MPAALTFRDLAQGLAELGLDPRRPAIAHASLSAFGEIRGGAETLLGAVRHAAPRLIMPAFTCYTMLIPEDGPEDNGITYGSGADLNRMAQFFHPAMPVDRLMGAVPEALRRLPEARRSSHPILSFVGCQTEEILAAQTIDEPLAPIRRLAEEEGWVLLLGVDHTVNTSIHYAEKLAGRRQFVRWALTLAGVQACPGFPGCSQGFHQAIKALQPVTRTAVIGTGVVRSLPLAEMLRILGALLADQPLALLCSTPDCERCNAVRKSVLYS